MTIKSGGSAQNYDPNDRFKPFLPADLYSKESSWICMGDDDELDGFTSSDGEQIFNAPPNMSNGIPADVHSAKFKWRSAFLSFIRAPGGRIETVKCIEKFNREEALPVGTQFALIEQAFLISDEGELVLSPLVVSISLRAYVGMNPHTRTGKPVATQSVAEFLMQPRQLMRGNAVMKALTPQDRRFEIGLIMCMTGGIADPFEASYPHIRPRLTQCNSCHGDDSPRTIGLNTARPRFLKEGSPEAISNATSARKLDDKTWKALHELWTADSAQRDAKSPAASSEYSDGGTGL